MPPAAPFVDPETGTLNTERILAETIPLAKLVGLFVAIALVPFTIALLLGPRFPLAGVLTLAAQFVLAIGSGIVLMYVISRAVQISDE